MNLEDYKAKWGKRGRPKKDPLEGFTKPDWEQLEKDYQGSLEIIKPDNKPKFKARQWVRHKPTGELGYLSTWSSSGYHWWTTIGGGAFTSLEEEWEESFPRKGEFWNYLKCKDHPKLRNIPRLEWKFDSHEAPSHVIKSIKELLRCECLVPENFGKGEEHIRFKTNSNETMTERGGLPISTYKPKFKEGQWVRGKNKGELVRVTGNGSEGHFDYQVRREDGCLWCVYDHEIEPALPRKGEWWRYKKCYRASHASSTPFPVTEWNEENTDWTYVKCCLEPVNFGKGE